MLSPYKLYKHDIQNQHKTKVTWGPKGKPNAQWSGSGCYKHCNLDWTVHRLTPEVLDRKKEGSRTHRAVHHAMNKYASEGTTGHLTKAELAEHLRATSPRWGDGQAPGLHGRNPKPRAHNVEISKNTKVAVAGAAVAGAGYYYYRKRKNGKVERVRNGNPKTHRSFHAVHRAAGVRH